MIINDPKDSNRFKMILKDLTDPKRIQNDSKRILKYPKISKNGPKISKIIQKDSNLEFLKGTRMIVKHPKGS